MHWLIILLIGCASSIDNFAVGLTYGTHGKQITRAANIFIALIALVVSYIALMTGRLIGYSIPQAFTGLCGGALILLIGIWTLFETLRNRKQASKTIPDADTVDKDHNNLITFREVLWLSFALSFNAMGAAFGAGVSGMEPVWVAVFVSLLSYVSIAAGQWLGLKSLRTPLGHISEFTASLLLIAIGIYTILSSSL